MVTEIKLFIITKLFFSLYATEERVMEQLEQLFGQTPFFKRWMPRYYQIRQSPEVQIILMREAGFTYRRIQAILKVAPSTIQHTVERYKINFQPLDHGEDISSQMQPIE